MAQRNRPTRTRALLAAIGATTVALALSAAPAVQAETPSPSPAPAVSSPALSTSPSPSGSATPTEAPRTPQAQAEPTNTPPTLGLTLAVGSTGGPVVDAFFEDLGAYAISGQTVGLADGDQVVVQRRAADPGGNGSWTTVATVKVDDATFRATLPVQAAGSFVFRATAAVTESPDLVSNEVAVTVAPSTVTLDQPAGTINSLKNLAVAGSVVPARAGVEVHVDVQRSGTWHNVATAKTNAAGRFTASVGYDKGHLASYTLRATFRATNSPRWEASATQGFKRIAVLDAEVDNTSGADVAKTYRKGCPVGPSKLRTVHVNYYGRDKLVHRGVIIIRTDLVPEITRAFDEALAKRYPIAKMNNPNVYGGNDPKQMKANNTSGFNCRKVVGNPYKQSPHSYGIAIDVNTVQNPYRDSKGKWWPSNGKSYIDRSPVRWGMLDKNSALTKQLRKDDFFWGGFWNPGRDYQHFQYTK